MHTAADISLRQVDELITKSADHTDLVHQLERNVDAAEGNPLEVGDLPTGDELAAELERYLRGDRGEGDRNRPRGLIVHGAAGRDARASSEERTCRVACRCVHTMPMSHRHQDGDRRRSRASRSGLFGLVGLAGRGRGGQTRQVHRVEGRTGRDVHYRCTRVGVDSERRPVPRRSAPSPLDVVRSIALTLRLYS